MLTCEISSTKFSVTAVNKLLTHSLHPAAFLSRSIRQKRLCRQIVAPGRARRVSQPRKTKRGPLSPPSVTADTSSHNHPRHNRSALIAPHHAPPRPIRL